jgi:hypothetical protein
MEIVHLTYAHVKPDQTVGSLAAQEHDAKVDAFLIDHLQDLAKRASSGNSPSAAFTDSTSSELFRKLRVGTAAEFLDAAKTLTTRLVAEMNGTTSAGLLVCLRAKDGTELSGAALKLEVMAEHGAVLEQLASGELKLSSATDVLQVPGELQKGALVPDSRADSDVVVGDVLAVNALYFPRAFGIVTEQRSSDTAASLVAAVHRHRPAISQRVATELPKVSPGPVRSVLDKVAETVPELDEATIAEVERDLVGLKRPVKRVDTGGPVKRVISVDGITISGTVAAMEKVRVNADPEVGWRVTITSQSQPREEYKR